MRSLILCLLIWALGVALVPSTMAGPRKSKVDEWFPHLREGMWIKVEGRMSEDDQFYATKIKILSGEQDEWEITSRVTEIEVTPMTLQSTIGVKVSAAPRTEIEKKTSDKKRKVGFALIEVGDRIEVEGQLQKDGMLLAEEIEIKKTKRLVPGATDKKEHKVKARIESLEPKNYSVELMGIRVYFNSKTKNKTPLLD